MKLKLTKEERRRIFHGDYRPLVRHEDPEIEGGEVIVLSRRRGGPQFLDRDDDARERSGRSGQAVTVEVPAEPTVWIECKRPRQRIKDGRREWLIEFSGHDTRQENRMLGASGVGPSSGGLRTRWGQTVDASGQAHPKRVPSRDEQQVESLTPETERGYTTGGRVIDHLAAVDDTELERQGAEARARFADFRRELAEEEEERRRQERAIRDRLRQVLRGLPPDGQIALLAAIERTLAEHESNGERAPDA